MTRHCLLLIALTCAVSMPIRAYAQFFEIPEVDLSDIDPTNPNGGLRKELRNLDKARLDARSRTPRAGRDYTKVYLKNDSNETISVAMRVIPFEVADGTSTLAEFIPGSPWRTLAWYKLSPGKRIDVVKTNNTILYTYAKSEAGTEWKGSHRVNLGKQDRPNYVQFNEKRIGIDVPEEWTFAFTSRNDAADGEKKEIRYSLWNDTKRNVKFRLPSGKTYTLSPGERETYHNEGVADQLNIHVYDNDRDYVLTSGKHKFFWMNEKNRLGFDVRYDKD